MAACAGVSIVVGIDLLANEDVEHVKFLRSRQRVTISTRTHRCEAFALNRSTQRGHDTCMPIYAHIKGSN